MKVEFFIRPATMEDLEQIVAVEREVPEAPHWSRTEYESIVERTDERRGLRRCLLVAEVNGIPAGFAVGRIVDAGVPAELESIVVHSAARGMGVGFGLCRALADWCRRQGAASMELEVRAENMAARALYERLGFVVEGIRRRYYQDPADDAVLMRLNLVSNPAFCG